MNPQNHQNRITTGDITLQTKVWARRRVPRPSVLDPNYAVQDGFCVHTMEEVLTWCRQIISPIGRVDIHTINAFGSDSKPVYRCNVDKPIPGDYTYYGIYGANPLSRFVISQLKPDVYAGMLEAQREADYRRSQLELFSA